MLFRSKVVSLKLLTFFPPRFSLPPLYSKTPGEGQLGGVGGRQVTEPEAREVEVALNLSLDSELYLNLMETSAEACMGLGNFMKRLGRACPWLKFGYFNPYLENGVPQLWT